MGLFVGEFDGEEVGGSDGLKEGASVGEGVSVCPEKQKGVRFSS